MVVHRAVSCFALVLAVAAPPLTAAVIPEGATVEVGAVAGMDQDRPAAAFFADGSSVVVWEHALSGLLAQRFDPAGVAVGDAVALAVNVNLGRPLPAEGDVSRHREPAVAVLAGGELMVAWTREIDHVKGEPFREERTAVERDVMVRVFGADLVAKGRAQRVHNADSPFQSRPQLVAEPSGGAFVVFDIADAGNSRGVAAQSLGADGSRRFATDVQVAPGPAANWSLAANDEGFAVGFESTGDGNGLAAFVRVYAADGSPRGRAARVNLTTAGGQRRPAVVATDDGWFVAFQGANPQDLRSFRIFGRFLSAAGATVGGELPLSAGLTYTQLLPRVATTTSGFLVSWSAWRNDTAYSFAGVELDATGAPAGEELWLVDGRVTAKSRGTLIIGDDGRALVAWPVTPAPRRSAVLARFFKVD